MMQVLFAASLAIIVGFAFLFYGYRLFLVLLPILGFFAGFWLGAETISLLFGTGFLATLSGWVIGFIAGLIAAILSYLFYLIGVALVAAAFGAALGAGLMSAFGFESGFLVTIVALAGAVISVGIVFLFDIQRYFVVAITAIGGANAVLAGILLLLGRIEVDAMVRAGNAIKPVLEDSIFWAIAWIAIAIIGIAYQLRAHRDTTFTVETYRQGWG